MGHHLALHTGHAIMSGATESVQNVEPSGYSREAVRIPIPSATFFAGKDNDNNVYCEEEEPLMQTVECRICQEEDYAENLEAPCNCSGSVKYAHRECVQRWCNEKGDITCEICHEQYKSGYTAPSLAHSDETIIEISEGWAIAGAPLDLHNPRLLAVAAAQRHFIEAEYDEYTATTNASGAAFCRSAALILMALLLLRHALNFTNDDGDDDDDASTMFSLFLLRAAGFLLSFYIVAWAISILQRRRQRQEAAALAATEVSFILQSGQGRTFQFTIAPDSPITPRRESHE